MIKVVVLAMVAMFSIPLAFIVFLVGPQSVNDLNNMVAACRTVLGMPPRPDTTVAEIGGADADEVATTPLTTTSGGDAEDPSATPTTLVEPVPELRGFTAYDFVSSLNTIDNWRELPAEELLRWALNPPASPLPPGAQVLPTLPETLTMADPVESAPQDSYSRACAAVVSRATKSEPPNGENRTVRPTPDALAATEGTTTDALGLLRVSDPAAAQSDPRQFYLQYWPVTEVKPGDIVLYDFTTAGPAHFGLALSAQVMLTTGSCCVPGPVQRRPIPTNASALSITPIGPAAQENPNS
ncbi:hypothetical protein ACWDTP_04650 [Mycobacterium sp. NPDC003449]